MVEEVLVQVQVQVVALVVVLVSVRHATPRHEAGDVVGVSGGGGDGAVAGG